MKADMVEPVCRQLYKWKHDGRPVKYIKCDIAGENKKLEKEVNGAQWKLAITFEYTSRSTPQRNHLAELGLSILTKHGVALMVRAHVPMKIRYQAFREAFKASTELNGLEAVTVYGKVLTRYEHCEGKIPSFVRHLRTWREAGTVKIKTAHQRQSWLTKGFNVCSSDTRLITEGTCIECAT